MNNKFQVENWDQIQMTNCFDHKTTLPDTQTFPPSDRNLKECSYRLRGFRAQEEQLKKENMLGCATYE